MNLHPTEPPALEPCDGDCLPAKTLREWVLGMLPHGASASTSERLGRACGVWAHCPASAAVLYVHGRPGPRGQAALDVFGWAMSGLPPRGFEALALEAFAADLPGIDSYCSAQTFLVRGGDPVAGMGVSVAAFADAVQRQRIALDVAGPLLDEADGLVFHSCHGAPVRWAKGEWRGSRFEFRVDRGAATLVVDDPAKGMWAARVDLGPTLRGGASVSVEEFRDLFRRLAGMLAWYPGLPRGEWDASDARFECPFLLRRSS